MKADTFWTLLFNLFLIMCACFILAFVFGSVFFWIAIGVVVVIAVLGLIGLFKGWFYV